jgi:hypothetical protein
MSLIHSAPRIQGSSRPHCVYLGSKAEAKNEKLLRKSGITHILNVTPTKEVNVKVGTIHSGRMIGASLRYTTCLMRSPGHDVIGLPIYLNNLTLFFCIVSSWCENRLPLYKTTKLIPTKLYEIWTNQSLHQRCCEKYHRQVCQIILRVLRSNTSVYQCMTPPPLTC